MSDVFDQVIDSAMNVDDEVSIQRGLCVRSIVKSNISTDVSQVQFQKLRRLI